jgi:hypothetical protein
MSYQRVILAIPDAMTQESLTPEQVAAIASVVGQYVMPMPGTISVDGMKVIDCIVTDNFDKQKILDFGLPFYVIGIWDRQGNALVPFDGVTFLKHLPMTQARDENGLPVGVPEPPVLHMPHTWSGWATEF